MAVVVSIINLKGGVAKTTTTIQLAECLTSQFSKKVLVIDLDPQSNATMSLIREDKWFEVSKQGQTIFNLFNDKLNKTNDFKIEKAIQKNVSNLKINTLDLLPSSLRFIGIQDNLSDIADKTGNSLAPMEVLKVSIHPILEEYDFILIDCPPNLGFITRNGIEISDYYLIPSIPDFLSTYGIGQIVGRIDHFKNERHLKIECLGLVLTKYDSRSQIHNRVKESIHAQFERIFEELKLPPPKIFNTFIPQANATAEAMEFSNPVVSFKQKFGKSESGGRYLHEYITDLTKEFMEYARK